MNRPPLAALLTLALLLVWNWGAVADDDDDDGDRWSRQAPITDLYVFGDSLSDSGNLFALTGGLVPRSPPYFNGRFSDGPVWVETLAPLLGLDVDFAATVLFDPLANNQAVAGAFTGTGNVNEALLPSLAGTGILGQVARFEAAGGRFHRRDVVIVWGGANNYIFDPSATPSRVVADLLQAVEWLSDLGARRFILPNLPDLGRTPLGTMFTPDGGAFLTRQSGAHNTRLARAAASMAHRENLQIILLDVETALDSLLDAGTVFANVQLSCLIGQGASPPIDTGACPGSTETGFDAGANGGALFWDLLHPTGNTHALIAFQAFGAVSETMGMDRPWRSR